MNNNNNCSMYTSGVPLPPMTGVPQCAVTDIGNMSAILNLCCGGPTANYADVNPAEPANCAIYCNITNPNLPYQNVEKCISQQAAAANINAGVILCGDGKTVNATASKPSSAIALGTSQLGWMAMGIIMVSMLIGS